MYLAISNMGFFVGFSVASTKKAGRKLGKTVRYMDCFSETDARSMVEHYVQGMHRHIHPYDFMVGALIFFRGVRTQEYIDLNTGIVKRYDDSGKVVLIDGNGKEICYSINPETLVPDNNGVYLLKRNGYLMYYRFRRDEKDRNEEGEVHIVKMGDNYKIKALNDDKPSEIIEESEKRIKVTLSSTYMARLEKEKAEICR